MNNLMEITKQESGIIAYGDSFIVCNWMAVCNNGGLPVRVSPLAGGLIVEWPEEDGLIVLSRNRVDDIRAALPVEPNIIYDDYGDIPALYGIDAGRGALIAPTPQAATVYRVSYSGGEAVIIAPDDWI